MADKFTAAGLPRITKSIFRIELPGNIRRETLKSEPKTRADFAKVFEDRGDTHVTAYADSLIELSGEPIDLELVWPSGRDLGLRRDAPFKRFLEVGQAAGLNLLRPEVGLYLREQDIRQPLGDWYCLAMEPVKVDRSGYADVLGLGRGGGGLWVPARWVDPGHFVASGLSFGLRSQQVKLKFLKLF